MPKKWKTIGVIGLIVGVLLVIVLISSLTSSSGLPEGPAEEVDLRRMLILYESNKLDAEEKYKGKLVRMQGSVKHIDDDYIEIIPYPSDQFQQSGARCNVQASERSKISGLVEQDLFKGRWGTTVTIRGIHKGFSGFMYTVAKIDRCQINPGPEPKPEPKASTQDTFDKASNSRPIQKQESGQVQSPSESTSAASGPESVQPSTPTLPPAPQYSAILASQDLGVGVNRVAFGLVDINGMPVRTDQANVQAVYFAPGQQQGEVRDEAVARFMPWPPPGNRGIFITNLTFDTPGEGKDALWELHISTTTNEGLEVAASTAVSVAESTLTPALGAPAPPSVTLTSADVDDLSTITSSIEPDPDLYRLSIYQALQEAKPLVVVFATPAFCVSATCGPQVEVLTQVKEKYRDQANFIHVEVFQDPHLIEGGRPAGDLIPAVEEWGLPTEPWTFVVDREGRVRAKFEQFTSFAEIETALKDLL